MCIMYIALIQFPLKPWFCSLPLNAVGLVVTNFRPLNQMQALPKRTKKKDSKKKNTREQHKIADIKNQKKRKRKITEEHFNN